MSGYNGYSKSNNAILAERGGRYPASRCAAMLRVPVEFVRAVGTGEWHHTSKNFKRTEYYALDAIEQSLETEDGKSLLASIMAGIRAKQIAEPSVRNNMTVCWLEWGGTRSYPKCTEREAHGATVIDRGGKFLEITLATGETFRKGKDTRGFAVKAGAV